MEVQYLREMRQNYLMIQVEEEQGQGYEARMMIGNTIEGLLRFRMKKNDGTWKFCYEITSKQPLSRVLEKTAVNASQIRRMLLEIARTLTRMEDYLLSEEQILMEPDYIYIDPEDYHPFLCLVPGKRGNFPQEFSLFLQFLLEKVNHEDKEAVVLIYGLYRESLKENYGLDNLLRWVMKENYPNMEYSGKSEKCETIDDKKIELWESSASDADSNPSQENYQQESRQNFAVRDKYPQYFYFLPGAAMILAAVGIRFFSGRQNLVRHGYWMAAAGAAMLAGGGLWRVWSRFSDKRKKRAPPSDAASRNSSYYTQFTSIYSQLFHDQTSLRRTSVGSTGNPSISDQNPQMKKSVQPGQWQMVFEEPEDEATEEVFMPCDSGKEEMHTVLLWDQNEAEEKRSLVSLDGESSIVLSYYPFIIGKQEGVCDYVLDKSTVSRLHVRIDEAEEGYRVTDLNSTNGTFINGRLLGANETMLVHPGDEIGVADLKFQLK